MNYKPISGTELRKRLDDLFSVMPDTPAAWRKHAEAVQRLVHQLHAEATQLRQHVVDLENAAEQFRRNSQDVMSRIDKMLIENESLRGQVATLKAKELAREQHAAVEAKREDKVQVEKLIWSLCSALTAISHARFPREEWGTAIDAAVLGLLREKVKRNVLIVLKERFNNTTVHAGRPRPDDEEKIEEMRRLVNNRLDEVIARIPD